jgi:anti-sigma factor RsiW
MSNKQLHDEVDKLLPWYVTGTLNEADTDRVDAALAARADAAALLNQETALSRRIAGEATDIDAVLARQPAAFEQLRQRLNRPTEPGISGGRQLSRWRQGCTAVLSLLVIGAVATSPWLAPAQPTGSYATLTQSAGGGAIQLVVTPGVSQTQVHQLIARLGGSIVSGPTPHNVYLIAVPEGSDIETAMQWLRNQPGVSFATPVVD